MLTAWAETADMVEGLEAGADDYITTPLDEARMRLDVQSSRSEV